MRDSRLAVVLGLGLSVSGMGCGSPSGVDCTLEPTPGGLAPRACVHEVPDNATVISEPDGGFTVTVDGGVVARYPPCPCANKGHPSFGPPPPSDAAAE
jgi:hypothetical protein